MVFSCIRHNFCTACTTNVTKLTLWMRQHVSSCRVHCGLKHSRSLTHPPPRSHNSSLPQSLTDTLTYCFTHTFDSTFTHWILPLHIQWFLHSFSASLIHSILHAHIWFFTHSFNASLIHSILQSRISFFTHSFNDSLSHSILHSNIWFFTHSFSVSLILHSFVASLTHCLVTRPQSNRRLFHYYLS
jgi:hypothetical protein